MYKKRPAPQSPLSDINCSPGNVCVNATHLEIGRVAEDEGGGARLASFARVGGVGVFTLGMGL